MGLPARFCLSARLLQMNLAVDMVDPRERNEMMGVAGVGIVLCQLYQISALQVVHGSHMYAVGTENFHAFFDQNRCNHANPPSLCLITRGNAGWFRGAPSGNLQNEE